MDVLICSRTESVSLLFSSIDGFCYLSFDKSCTTCLLISKSFKELFFMAFFRKADAKVRLIFEPPKLFRRNFQKSFFEMEAHVSVPLFSISTSSRFPLESGCKITALQHICQMLHPTFLQLSAKFLLTLWFVEGLVSGEFFQVFKGGLYYTLLLFARAYIRIYI